MAAAVLESFRLPRLSINITIASHWAAWQHFPDLADSRVASVCHFVEMAFLERGTDCSTILATLPSHIAPTAFCSLQLAAISIFPSVLSVLSVPDISPYIRTM